MKIIVLVPLHELRVMFKNEMVCLNTIIDGRKDIELFFKKNNNMYLFNVMWIY
jgi:hypothetical protein